MKDSRTAGRAKRGALGSFAGRRPSKSPTKLAAFEKRKAVHYAQKAAKKQREPMRVESLQPRKKSEWQKFVAKELQGMTNERSGQPNTGTGHGNRMAFAAKMVELSKKWKILKVKDNRVGQTPPSRAIASDS